jgi:hypothetical protein
MALCVVTDTPIEKDNKLVPANVTTTQLRFEDNGIVTWVDAPFVDESLLLEEG